jgi:signal peptidase I
MNLFIALDLTTQLLLRSLLAQPFTIPAGSMMPTLDVGNYVVASKFSYGYSNFSLPYGHYLPAFTYARRPVRRDVVIFRLPSDTATDYIKRVIGLPGDAVRIRNGITYLNGIALRREPAGVYDGPDPGYRSAPEFIEYLPDGRSYTILELVGASEGDNTALFTVPPDHYFVMGDNRDNSNDSRFGVGFVPEANIFAKAIFVVTWPNGKFIMHDIR